MLQRASENEHFASFLRMIWIVAGHAGRWLGRNEREKSKPSPNLKVGLPQLSRVGSVPGRFFEGWDWVELDFALTPKTISFRGRMPSPVENAEKE